MRRVELVAGIGLITTAAVLLGASRVVPAQEKRSLSLMPAPRRKASHLARRRCVRLGWKAPYWYAGA